MPVLYRKARCLKVNKTLTSNDKIGHLPEVISRCGGQQNIQKNSTTQVAAFIAAWGPLEKESPFEFLTSINNK